MSISHSFCWHIIEAIISVVTMLLHWHLRHKNWAKHGILRQEKIMLEMYLSQLSCHKHLTFHIGETYP